MKSLLEQIERVPINTLIQYPTNPNIGDVPSIAESLKENGLFEPVIVQRSTGYILSGNHTVLAALKLGWREMDVAVVDVDDMRALKILLAANRTRDKAHTNRDVLAEVLSYLDEDYVGTGYTSYDVDLLIEQSALDPRGLVDANPDDEFGDLLDAPAATETRVRRCPRCAYDLTNDPDGLR